MRFLTWLIKWWSGLRKGAASLHPRARITGIVDFYSPLLDSEIGEAVGCWRLAGERDYQYAHRLGLHITSQLNELEALLQRLYEHRR